MLHIGKMDPIAKKNSLATSSEIETRATPPASSSDPHFVAGLALLACAFYTILFTNCGCHTSISERPNPQPGTLIQERWIGTLGNHPLQMNLLELGADSLSGIVILTDKANEETLQIVSGIRPQPDSLFLNLETPLPKGLYIRRLWGASGSTDSLSGRYVFQRLNDFPFRADWQAVRVKL
jgi:hypothetical protein